MDTRREFFKKAMLLSGSAGLSGVMPQSLQRALAINPEPGSTYLDAEHVVILMQENRSFDHSYGTLNGVRGYNDRHVVTLPNSNKVWLQTSKKGETYAPFRFDLQNTKITWMGATPHDRASQVDANNRGKHDQWLNAKGTPMTMGYYTRQDIPFYYALADAFTVCDQNFSSVMGATWPNRLYMWGGTIRDRNSDNTKAYVRNVFYPYEDLGWKTFPERLEENNVSWKVYQNEMWSTEKLTGEAKKWLSNFGCNMLEWLSQFNGRFLPGYIESLHNRKKSLTEEISKLKVKAASNSPSENEIKKINKAITKKQEVLADTEKELIKWTRENFEKLSDYQKNLFYRAYTTNLDDPDYHKLTKLTYTENGEKRHIEVPKGDILYQFRKDVDTGKLPTVSWLVPPQHFSDHPGSPWYGVWYTSEILDILTKNPDVWKKTIFIMTYDENDGYFDHVPPFLPPDTENVKTGKCSPGIDSRGEYIKLERELQEGITPKNARGGPIGLGFRVPMIIASPWSRGGKVCSQVFDHTSTIQFLEDFLSKKFRKKVNDVNISPWRRTVCGNLTAAFSKYEVEDQNNPSFLAQNEVVKKIYNAKFKKAPSDYRPLTPEEIEAVNRYPASSGVLPRQEPGVRPSCALPYQLYADGSLSDDRKTFHLKMKAGNEVFKERSAGSPFNLYAPGRYATAETEDLPDKIFEPVRVWHYAVRAGEELTDNWPLSHFEGEDYHLCLFGPNGFVREFMGSADDPLLDVNLEYQRISRLIKHQLTGNVDLSIRNRTNNACEIDIIDNAYQKTSFSKIVSASGQVSIVLDLKSSFRWYDFTVRIKENTTFLRRYAGRVETGNHLDSYSDPAMG